MTPQILIVEDELKMAQVLAKYLEREGYQCQLIADGAEVMPWLAANAVNLILLDLNLPHRDGLTLCREIRQTLHTPIIMTTARVDEIDRLLGLELGADDYVCKPYSPREVVARVKAVLRRTLPTALEASTAAPASGLKFDDDRLLASLHGQALNLTRVEYQLLKRLAEQPGRIYSRDQLMDHIYSDHRVVHDRTIDSHIKKLRRKLEGANPDAEVIHSVYGLGYKLEMP